VLASNSVIARVPLMPRLTWSQKVSRPTPNVDTTPMPVMAIFTLHLLYHLAVLIAWGGAIAFATSLVYLVYFYVVILAGTTGDPARRLESISLNAALFAVFALHHSLLARESAKRIVRQVVSSRFERSLYVWVASALAIGIAMLWQPVAGVVYRFEGGLRLPFWIVQIAGVTLTVLAARAISALELAGIHQTAGRVVPGSLKIVGPFRLVRHPIYLGWVLMVFGTANMTANRLVFAVISTAYLILAIPWEERSLVAAHGGQYREYQRLVRWRLIPGVW
jgi:protein-S-isoprenylcysteine O-methyltransferase Ste14